MNIKRFLKAVSMVTAVIFVYQSYAPISVYSVEDISNPDETVMIEDIQTSEISVPEIEEISVPEIKAETAETQKLPVYEENSIVIYNYDQLLLMGSNTPVTDGDARAETVGKGELVLNEDGDIVMYRPGARYRFAHDIVIPKHQTWQLPDNFSGSIYKGIPKEMPLYDSETDTVYIYDPYQLEVMVMENADSQPILDGDGKAETFGTGKLIFPYGEDKPYLTYSSSHNYVLSEYFNSAVKNSVSVLKKAPPVRAVPAQYDGRDFQGQVIKTLNGVKYILIGNEDQLRAIGTNAPVYTAVYKSTDESMLYGGDADLLQSQNGNANYAFQNIGGTVAMRYGVDQETGRIKRSLGSYDTRKNYSNTENYIIFRDIDLEYRLWTPKMFHGTMTGAKALRSGEKLWDNAEINTDNRPVISHVSINQTQPINIDDYYGVGFFATITPKDGGPSTVSVKNIELNEVSVNNSATEITSPPSLISDLTGSIGGGLGAALNLILKPLTGVDFDLSGELRDLLDARLNDRSNLATGAFSGRVKGKVEIEDCAVTGTTVSVTSVNDRTGGFIGYSDGEEKYDPLSGLLGDVVSLLANVLNIIPGVGLGDLVTILLENGLPLGKIIPIGYDNPIIRNCEVDGLQGGIGRTDTQFNGGFIGQQIGTIIENCEIKNSNYIVQAEKFGGGFAGITRDEAIRSTLGDLGIEFPNLLQNMQPKSILKDCEINNSTVVVNGTENLGGFTGALCSSYAVNCSIVGQEENTLKVIGSGDYVGGFCGEASLGWTFSGNDENKASLLSTVGGIVSNLAGDGKSALLSLAGADPSVIMGVQMDCGEIEVSGRNYVGGILGKGDGVRITESSDENLQNLLFWKYGTFPSPEESEVRDNYVNHLKSVVASDSYAGGIAGSVGTASAVGLLNTTLGIGDFIGFDVSNVTVNGIEGGYTVAATNNFAGGGFGETIGGTIDNVTLNELKLVSADSRAAGFVGCSGPGDLVGSEGLSLHLLGLDSVLEAKNLLSLGQGVEVRITNCNVNGIESGFVVWSTHDTAESDIYNYTAGGFVAKSNSTYIENSHVHDLYFVRADDKKGYAGGFIGTSECGGLSDVADEASVGKLIEADGLVNAVSYMIPDYINCTVTYVDGGFVMGDYAGGFVADLESGTVNNSSRTDDDYYAVYNIDRVQGYSYGGGFGGRLVSGALASVGGGLSVLGGSGLNLNIGDLLNVANAYIPIVDHAGVYSKNGFTVSAFDVREDDSYSGSAGGFAGFMSGAQISYSNVNKLKHTVVTPPQDLESISAPTYFDSNQSKYSVTGGRYAGGYVANMNIGSAASLGSGLTVLEIDISDILSSLNVVVSTIEHSDVIGGAGGFSVLCVGNDSSGAVGMAGGYAGQISGGHIQNSHSRNFDYIIGMEAAGGYVGEMKPGSAAEVLGSFSLPGGLADISSLASLLQSFVPTIRNSTTTCIPCGGAVRAHAPSDSAVQRGMAGGYCGHNKGGNIWGFDNHTWKDQNDGIIFHEDENHIIQQINTNHNTEGRYEGEKHECRADRIRSVYGYEYAGGFTGFMETADTAETGGISLLGGLLNVSNLLTLFSVVYPTERNTAVYGPLSNLDLDTWNKWIDYVGKYGKHGIELLKEGKAKTQEELDSKLSKYIYGYHVVAGRPMHEQFIITEGGNAGGYVGYMLSGVIQNGQGYDAKLVRAMRNTGGFAGKMQTGGASNLGSASVLHLHLDLGQLIGALQVFVPKIESSSVRGYQSGLTVQATGDTTDDILNTKNIKYRCGNAGGYVGSAYGAQIWGDKNNGAEPKGCNVTNLRVVQGRNAIGGYVGYATAASVADVNTNISDDPEDDKPNLQNVLNSIISSPDALVQLVQATLTNIKQTEVSAYNEQYGYSVKGLIVSQGGQVTAYYPLYAGGFAGSLEATIVGDRDGESEIKVTNLREVDGGYYAGGFCGLADVTSAAAVAQSGSGQASLLSGLGALQQISVLDAFRTYIYHAEVEGTSEKIDGVDDFYEGIIVRAHLEDTMGLLGSRRYAGCAGGFCGGLMNGTVKNSSVKGVNTVTGLNYSGGFIGHMGKGGAVDVDGASLAGLLSASAGVLDVFGSQAVNCSVEGIDDGMVVLSGNGSQSVSGGFVGYAEVSTVENSHVTKQKQVYSDEIAGGFVGKTEMSYLIDLQADSPLVHSILGIVNSLLGILYVGNLANIGLLTVEIPGLENVLSLNVLVDGDVLSVTLLGLPISVSLIRATDGGTDTAAIHIGDSYIELPCSENDGVGENPEVEIHLLKGNTTVIEDSSVKGIPIGYDVYGGGASNYADGTDTNGYAGGFVGYNSEGMLTNNQMIYCDVVRGYDGKVGHFTGFSTLETVYNHTIDEREVNNRYSVYREIEPAYRYALTSSLQKISEQQQDTETDITYNRYDAVHRSNNIVDFADWENAVMSKTLSGGSDDIPIEVYESSAKAVLMLNTPTELNGEGVVPEPEEYTDPCERVLTYKELDIKKIWDDDDDFNKKRPESIKIRVWQYNHYADGSEILDNDGNSTKMIYRKLPNTDEDGYIEISAAENITEDLNVWEYIAEHLPASSVSEDDETGEESIIYYSYRIEEVSVEGYMTSIRYNTSDTTFLIEITNSMKDNLLPNTGGRGVMIFILTGLIIFTLALYGFIKTKLKYYIQYVSTDSNEKF